MYNVIVDKNLVPALQQSSPDGILSFARLLLSTKYLVSPL